MKGEEGGKGVLILQKGGSLRLPGFFNGKTASSPVPTTYSLNTRKEIGDQKIIFMVSLCLLFPVVFS